MNNTFYDPQDGYYLAHYGVPGMKWGVRHDKYSGLGGAIRKRRLKKIQKKNADVINKAKKADQRRYDLEKNVVEKMLNDDKFARKVISAHYPTAKHPGIVDSIMNDMPHLRDIYKNEARNHGTSADAAMQDWDEVASSYLTKTKNKDYASAVQEYTQYRDTVNAIVNQYKDISSYDLMYRR